MVFKPVISLIWGYIGFTQFYPWVKLTVLPSFTQFYPTGFTHWVKRTCQPCLQLRQTTFLPHDLLDICVIVASSSIARMHHDRKQLIFPHLVTNRMHTMTIKCDNNKQVLSAKLWNQHCSKAHV